MDKTELRRRIREKKRAMTPEEIEERSRELGRQFAATEAYRKAKTIYGYMPYNQEVRTVPMLEQALRDGKKVAVPKCYGDEMKFIYLDDLTKVAKGYAGIPEPIADEPGSRDADGAGADARAGLRPPGTPHRLRRRFLRQVPVPGAEPSHAGAVLRFSDAAPSGHRGT